MTTKWIHRGARIGAAALVLALGACGGGGGGSSQSTAAPPVATPPPAQGQSTVTKGAITSIGASSITVNGVAFDTAAAQVSKDDDPASLSQLEVGHVVTIHGRVDGQTGRGRAERVECDDDLEGPISSIDVANGTFVVLGQTVRIDANTSFDDGASLASLQVGVFVEVNGFANAAGEIVATRIEVKGAVARRLEITGGVSDLDTARKRFNIGPLVVDYSRAMLEDFPGGEPRSGDFVEVHASGLSPAGELLATRVELEDDLPVGGAVQIELEGLITRIISPTEFEIGGRVVVIQPGTVIEFEGEIRIDLAADVKVEVEGTIDANGRLIAVKISIRPATSARLAARVDSVDANARELRVLGVRIRMTGLTRFEDQSDARLRPFGLDDLRAGDYVEVRGMELPVAAQPNPPSAGPRMLAFLIERRSPDDEVRVRGRVRSVERPRFSILGITLETNAATRYELMTADEFFANALGRIADAKGTSAGDVVTVREVEFE
jgi:hypothetical protein